MKVLKATTVILLVLGTSAGACDSMDLLKCIPDSDYKQCKAFITDWGSANQDSSIVLLEKAFLSASGQYDVNLKKTIDDGLTADMVIYGCYSRQHFEDNGGLGDHSDRLMFHTKATTYFPDSNPEWKDTDSLVEYEKIGLYSFTGVDSDKDRLAHIYFVKRTDTGENPCCGGGFVKTNQELLGYLVSSAAVREVFRELVENDDNQTDDFGAGLDDLTHSTFTITASSNTVFIGGERTRSFYDYSGPDVPGQEPPPVEHKSTTVDQFKYTWRWDGRRFTKSEAK